MHTLTPSEVRQYLIALNSSVDSVDFLMHQLEGTPEGLTVEGVTDPVYALREKVSKLRAAYGYTPTGLLLKHTPQLETPLPEIDTLPGDIPAPRGWGMIEAGHESIPGTCTLPELLRNQAA